MDWPPHSRSHSLVDDEEFARRLQFEENQRGGLGNDSHPRQQQQQQQHIPHFRSSQEAKDFELARQFARMDMEENMSRNRNHSSDVRTTASNPTSSGGGNVRPYIPDAVRNTNNNDPQHHYEQNNPYHHQQQQQQHHFQYQQQQHSVSARPFHNPPYHQQQQQQEHESPPHHPRNHSSPPMRSKSYSVPHGRDHHQQHHHHHEGMGEGRRAMDDILANARKLQEQAFTELNTKPTPNRSSHTWDAFHRNDKDDEDDEDEEDDEDLKLARELQQYEASGASPAAASIATGGFHKKKPPPESAPLPAPAAPAAVPEKEESVRSFQLEELVGGADEDNAKPSSAAPPSLLGGGGGHDSAADDEYLAKYMQQGGMSIRNMAPNEIKAHIAKLKPGAIAIKPKKQEAEDARLARFLAESGCSINEFSPALLQDVMSTGNHRSRLPASRPANPPPAAATVAGYMPSHLNVDRNPAASSRYAGRGNLNGMEVRRRVSHTRSGDSLFSEITVQSDTGPASRSSSNNSRLKRNSTTRSLSPSIEATLAMEEEPPAPVFPSRRGRMQHAASEVVPRPHHSESPPSPRRACALQQKPARSPPDLALAHSEWTLPESRNEPGNPKDDSQDRLHSSIGQLTAAFEEVATPLEKKKKKFGFLKFGSWSAQPEKQGSVPAGLPSLLQAPLGDGPPLGIPPPSIPPPPIAVAPECAPRSKAKSRPSIKGSAACYACGKMGGTFVQALERKYHSNCFRCYTCHELIDVSKPFAFSVDSNGVKHPHHRACYTKSRRVSCVVCHSQIPANEDGTVMYVNHPFFESEHMCIRHTNERIRRCDGCNRFEPRDAPFADLDDAGRCVCFSCCRTVIMNNDDVEPLWQQVIGFFENHLGLPIWEGMRQIPVLAVDSETLSSQMRQHDSIHDCTKNVIARGLCVTNFQTLRPFKMPSLRFNQSSSSFEAQDNEGRGFKYFDLSDSSLRRGGQKKLTQTVILAVLCRSGLPKDLTAGVLAHEALHAWIKLHPDFSAHHQLPAQIEEGCAQLVAHLFLRDGLPPADPLHPGDSGPSDEKLRQYFRFSIESEKDEVFGMGYRKASKAFSDMGMARLLNYVLQYNEFPDNNSSNHTTCV